MFILFTKAAVYGALKPVTHEEGSVLECENDYGRRWLRRGKAVEITAEEFKAAKAAPKHEAKPKGKK